MKPWMYTRRRRRRPALSSFDGSSDSDWADMERASFAGRAMGEGAGRKLAVDSLRGGKGGGIGEGDGEGTLPASASSVYGGGGDCDAMASFMVLLLSWGGVHKGHCAIRRTDVVLLLLLDGWRM